MKPGSTFVEALRQDARIEARHLLSWWSSHMVDEVCGGFWGEVDFDDKPVPQAPKSAILTTRLLWFFSAMAGYLASDDALQLAHRAANYVKTYFLDTEHGGIWWLLDPKGQVLDAKKQAYAQAFAVYAFAEYYHATGDQTGLMLARQLQREIDERFWDPGRGGYIEATSALGFPAQNQRLSEKDADQPKTMNTHLHILEAYTRLHHVAPDEVSNAALSRVLNLFLERFVDQTHHNLKLFFDLDWQDHSEAVSFGHDIEASWLIWEAAVALNEPDLMARVKIVSLDLAREVLRRGTKADGGLCYERHFSGDVDRAGEWWGQAEGLVGFINAWELSGDIAFLHAAEALWLHTREQFGAGGTEEWTWYAKDSGRDLTYKAGMWKCPYHNGRAMMELDRRLKRARLK